MQKILLLLLAPLFLTACQGEIENLLDSPQTVEVAIYENDRALNKYLLTAKDPEYQAIKQWIKRNKTGWHSSPASYLPSITITGNDFSLNFTKDLAVINYGGKQYIKRITKNDCTSLIETCS